MANRERPPAFVVELQFAWTEVHPVHPLYSPDVEDVFGTIEARRQLDVLYNPP
jgi:hypothetical protein